MAKTGPVQARYLVQRVPLEHKVFVNLTLIKLETFPNRLASIRPFSRLIFYPATLEDQRLEDKPEDRTTNGTIVRACLPVQFAVFTGLSLQMAHRSSTISWPRRRPIDLNAPPQKQAMKPPNGFALTSNSESAPVPSFLVYNQFRAKVAPRGTQWTEHLLPCACWLAKSLFYSHRKSAPVPSFLI